MAVLDARGTVMVSGAWDGCIAVWSLAQQYMRDPASTTEPLALAPLRLLRAAHVGAVLAVAAAAAGSGGVAFSRAATAGADHAVRVWRIAEGGREVAAAWGASAVRDGGAGAGAGAGAGGAAVGALAWGCHSSARLLFAGSWDHAVRAWDPDELSTRPAAVAKLRGHGSRVTCLAVSACGLFLASGAADGAVLVWSTGSFEFLVRCDLGVCVPCGCAGGGGGGRWCGRGR